MECFKWEVVKLVMSYMEYINRIVKKNENYASLIEYESFSNIIKVIKVLLRIIHLLV